MKKLIVLALVFIAVSCSKEKDLPTPQTPPPLACNCGLITDDNASNYSIDIRNSCSGNIKTFVLTRGDWMNAHPGDNFCINNVSEW
tara:strand:- start:309 stop:566 length:258 start_codon:yes stop_codon:yes gene_type:complete